MMHDATKKNLPFVSRDDMTPAEKSAVHETIRKVVNLQYSPEKAAEYAADRFCCNDSRITEIRNQALSMMAEMGLTQCKCGSTEDAYYSRTSPMSYFCPDCGEER